MFQDQHAALPKATHDEFAREEFCSSLRKMFTTELFPGGADVYYKHQLPAFEAKHGRPPKVTDESFYSAAPMSSDVRCRSWFGTL
jgi:hypothetical protein